MRLDLLLVERGLAENRSVAQRLVMAGRVHIDGAPAMKPGMSVSTQVELNVDPGAAFASRGGEKLEALIQAYDLDINNLVCADVGASTGGFTDCLLQHGAAKVYAIDVGHGILAWALRQDKRVVVMERQNARYIESLPEQVSLITVDVSFISLKIMLQVFKRWFSTLTPPAPSPAPLFPPIFAENGGMSEGQGGGVVRGTVLALIKPQFEAGRAEVKRGGGVIRDPQVHLQVLVDVLGFAEQEGYDVRGLIRSPLLGPKGNTEFLVWLSYPASETSHIIEMVELIAPTHNEEK